MHAGRPIHTLSPRRFGRTVGEHRAYQAAADSGACRTGALCDSNREFLPPLQAGVYERDKKRRLNSALTDRKKWPNFKSKCAVLEASLEL